MSFRQIAVTIAVIFMAAGAAHTAWSGFIAFYAAIIYDHRAPNVRRLDQASDWPGLLAGFIISRSKIEEPLVAIAGSSFSFGYSFAASVPFSRHIAEFLKDKQVLNVSIIGSTSSGMRDSIGCALILAGRPIDTLVIEIPVINDTSAAQRGAVGRRPINCPGETVSSMFNYVFDRPYGFNWLGIIRDEFWETAQSDVVLAPLPNDWIPSAKTYKPLRDALHSERVSLIRQMRPLAKRIIVFQSPIYVDGLVELGFERSNVELQFRDGIVFCHNLKEVICLDTFELGSKSAIFRDVAHLNKRGHEIFADWLNQRLAEEVR